MPSQSQTRLCSCATSNANYKVTVPIRPHKRPLDNFEPKGFKVPDFGLKKFLAVTLLVGTLSLPGISYAQNYSKISDDIQIERAIIALNESHADKVINTLMGDNPSRHPVKIMFYNLCLLSPQYSDTHALATSDNDGTMYILIDSKYQNEPPEALASIIAHEITHQLPRATLDEEIQAWTNETRQWIEFKKNNPKLALLDENKYRLVKRLNYLEKLYTAGNNSNELIAEAVMNNKAYRTLSYK